MLPAEDNILVAAVRRILVVVVRHSPAVVVRHMLVAMLRRMHPVGVGIGCCSLVAACLADHRYCSRSWLHLRRHARLLDKRAVGLRALAGRMSEMSGREEMRAQRTNLDMAPVTEGFVFVMECLLDAGRV